MSTIAEMLAEHVVRVCVEDIAPETIHEIKRGILDTIGCCLGGLSMNKGRSAFAWARRMGGLPEATIIGLPDKVAAVNAGFANGETANAKDWSAGCAFHDVPIVVSAALAAGEAVGVSGKDLLTAVAVGLEISGRVGRAGANAYTPVKEGPDKGTIHWDPVTGMAHGTFGAAAATGKILQLTVNQTAHALGIAGYLCPPQTFRKFNVTVPIRNTKYGPLGWITQSGMTAAFLAESGYTGDNALFEGEYGYGRYTGALQWRPERILRNLGEKVPRLRLFFKVYPMGRILPGAVDNLVALMRQERLSPEEVDRVTAKIHILGSFPCFTQNRLETEDDYCFHAPYALSCAAYGIPPVRWHEDETRKDPRIREFMKRVSVVFDEKEDGLSMIEDPQARPMWVEVLARGRLFRRESSHIIGSYSPEAFRMTDTMLKEKFRSQADAVLPPEKTQMIEKLVFSLENLERVSELMRLTAP